MKFLLQRAAGGRGRSARYVADHTGLIGVETTLAGGAGADRIALQRVARGRLAGARSERKRIAALGAAGKIFLWTFLFIGRQVTLLVSAVSSITTASLRTLQLPR